MDNLETSEEYRRFLNGVLQSPPAQNPESLRSNISEIAEADTSAIQLLLQQIGENKGLSSLDQSEIETLLLPENNSNLAAHVISIIRNNSHFDTRLVALVSDDTTPKLLIAFLCVLLNQERFIAVKQSHLLHITEIKTVIGFRALKDIFHLRRGNPVFDAWRDRRRSFACDISSLGVEIRALVNKFRPHGAPRDPINPLSPTPNDDLRFESFVRPFTQDLLDDLVLLRHIFKEIEIRQLDPSGDITALEYSQYEELRAIEAEISRSRDRTTFHREEREALETARSELRRGTIAWDDRDVMRREIRDLARAERTSNSRTSQLNTEKSKLRRSLGRRISRIATLLNQTPSITREMTARRDEILREFDQLVAGTSELRLLPNDDARRWRIFSLLIKLMVDGDGWISIELAQNAFLSSYGWVNANRNIGYYTEYSAGTYAGHGYNALDLSTAPRSRIYVAAPASFRLPERTNNTNDPPSVTFDTFDYQSSIVERARRTSDIQDIFAKIAYGLLRRHGNRSVRSDELRQIMEDHGPSDLGPDFLSEPNERNFDARRIISGLGGYDFTDLSDATGFEDTRLELLGLIERDVQRQLDLPRNTLIFNRSTSATRVGLSHIIVYRPIQPVIVATKNMMERLDQNCNDLRCSDGIVHRLWRFLWYLRSAGADPHRKGQAVYIKHTFQSSGTAPRRVSVTVRYMHLRALASGMRTGSSVTLGDQIGQVGITGNSVSSHIHLEIEAEESGQALETLLPHEFFDLL